VQVEFVFTSESGSERHAMKIGLTYDLRDEYLAAGYDEEATAEFASVMSANW
jgi:hypothetical protein